MVFRVPGLAEGGTPDHPSLLHFIRCRNSHSIDSRRISSILLFGATYRFKVGASQSDLEIPPVPLPLSCLFVVCLLRLFTSSCGGTAARTLSTSWTVGGK